MKNAPPALQTPNQVIVACLVTIFILGLAMIGAHSAVATAAESGCAGNAESGCAGNAESGCAGNRDQTVLVGLAGNTLSLLAKEALGVLKIGAATMATVVLAIARNLGGIGLWVYAVYLAMMSHMALVVAGVLLLSVVYSRKGSRS